MCPFAFSISPFLSHYLLCLLIQDWELFITPDVDQRKRLLREKLREPMMLFLHIGSTISGVAHTCKYEYWVKCSWMASVTYLRTIAHCSSLLTSVGYINLKWKHVSLAFVLYHFSESIHNFIDYILWHKGHKRTPIFCTCVIPSGWYNF